MASPRNQLNSSNSNRCKLDTCDKGDDVSHRECEISAASEIEDVDIEMQFCFLEGLSDLDDCTWLSSSSTPSSFQNRDNALSLDTLEIDFIDALLYFQFSNMSPMFRGNGTSFGMDERNFVSDLSCTDSIDASIILEIMQKGTGEGPDDFSDDNGINCSSISYAEAIESGYRSSFCEDSSNSNSSWSSLGTHDEEASHLVDHDLYLINIWLPLPGREGEEFKGDDDAFYVPGQDPSTSYHTQRETSKSISNYNLIYREALDVQAPSGSSGPSPIFNLSQEHVIDGESLTKDLDADEPLFWPFDHKSYWSPELEGNYLGISSCPSILDVRRPIRSHASKSVQFTLHHKNDFSQHKKHAPQRYKGRILLNSISSKSICADCETTYSHNQSMPFNLSRSTRTSYVKASCNLSKKKGAKGHHQSNPVRSKFNVNQENSLSQYVLEFDVDDFQIYLAGGIPIEALIGLDEFDGHEGIGRMKIG